MQTLTEISLTETACTKVKEMMAQEGKTDLYLRVGVQAGGCSGFSYGMGFEDSKDENDTLIELHGIKVLVDEFSAPYLNGVEIDYKENLMGGGFTIHNPNAVSTCGCGHSFRTAEGAGEPSQC